MVRPHAPLFAEAAEKLCLSGRKTAFCKKIKKRR